MRIPRLMLTAAVSVALAGLAQAQTTASPAKPASPAAPVIDLIPAGAMGFVIINDITKTGAAAEEFLAAIGITQMLDMPAEGPWLVDMIKAQAMLGDGFNPSAGFAVVLLDPHQFDVDLAAMLSLPGSASTKPAGKLPVVILVPGTSVEEVFANYPIEKSGDYDVVALRMGPMLAAKVGDHIALSPTPETLAALINAKKKISAELTKAQQADIAQSDLSIHVNMKIAGPIFAGMMKNLQATMASAAGPGVKKLQADAISLYMDAYSDVFLQMDAVSLSVQLRKAGLKLAVRAAFAPESDWGQALAEYKPVKGARLLGKLPDLPYVLAYGGAWQSCPQKVKELASKIMSRMFTAELLADLPAQTKTDVIKLTEKYYDQTSAFQLYLGGAPTGSGLIGMSVLTEFTDAAEGKAMIKELAPIYETLAKAVAAGHEDLGQLEIDYLDEAETINGTSVDVIEIKYPGLAKLTEKERSDLEALLGETDLRMRVAAADDRNVLMTFGGSQAMLAESLKAARTGGKIQDALPVRESLKHMPSDPIVLCLFNAANLMDLVDKANKATTPQAQPLPCKITADQPVAMAAAVTGSDVTTTLYVPSAVIEQIIKFAGAMAEMKMTPQTGPHPTTKDDGGF